MYFAIIGDIINSKKIEKRNEIQKQLEKSLQIVNKKYKNEIISKFTITLGDEFQGLLKTGIKLLEIIDEIKFLNEEIDIRFGIGYGQIRTTINKELSIGADGEAYWNARDAIDSIHQKVPMIAFRAEKEDNLIQSQITLFAQIENNYTKAQYKFVKEIFLNYGYNTDYKQIEASKKLGISKQNIFKYFQKTGYINLINAKKQINIYIGEKYCE